MDSFEPNFDPFPILVTERLLLRRVTESDAEELFRMRSDPNVMKYIGRVPAKTIDDVRGLIKQWDESLDSRTGITWAISLKENPRKLMGTVGLWRLIAEHYRAEVGYMLIPEYWRQGISKEALVKVLDYGFLKMRLHSIEAHIDPNNIASATLLENTAFVKEGHFRESFFFNGVFEDTAIYSLLAPKSSIADTIHCFHLSICLQTLLYVCYIYGI